MSRFTRHTREGGSEYVGMVWQRMTLEHPWIRTLLRQWKRSHEHDWIDLAHVDPDVYEFCLRCLSQNVVVDERDAAWLVCHSCNMRFRVIY